MIVGTEWLIEAFECDAEKLREVETLREVFKRVIADLGLKTVGDGFWHQFAGEKGVTGLVALTESHLACHTYPEYRTATFNLYCCKTRPTWDWESNLCELLGAEKVQIQKIERGEDRNAVVPAAVAGASRSRDSFPKVSFGEVTIRERGRLPHWEAEDGIYFVTFRLADSLPEDVRAEIKAEREAVLRVLDKTERELSPTEKRKINSLFSEKIEEYLDNGYGECSLKKNEVGETVADALRHFDGDRYHLFAWCVMPNHVHAVFRTRQTYQLEDILHSWKSFTAHKINKILTREGEFWQREYYDHLVRNQEEFERIIKYVLDNPLKAGLKNWRWVEGLGKYKRAATP